MKISISLHSTVITTREPVSCELGGEAVILNVKKAWSFTLNAVEGWIFELVQQERTLLEVSDLLLKKYADTDSGALRGGSD